VRFDAAHALVCVAPLIGDGVGLAAISSPTNVVLAGATASQLEAPRSQAGLGRNVDPIQWQSVSSQLCGPTLTTPYDAAVSRSAVA
jgi:hypothetical protein